MAETLFVALFVILPLAAAVLFLLYRARIFLRNMLVVGLIAVGVWGALKLAAADYGLFERRGVEPALHQPASCYAARPGGRGAATGCAL